MRLSRMMRRQMFYSVEEAGGMPPLRWSRTESYRRARAGDIPTEKHGRFFLVPRGKWDAERARLREQMRAAGLKRLPPAPTAPAIEPEAKAEAEADTVTA